MKRNAIFHQQADCQSLAKNRSQGREEGWMPETKSHSRSFCQKSSQMSWKQCPLLPWLVSDSNTHLYVESSATTVFIFRLVRHPRQ